MSPTDKRIFLQPPYVGKHERELVMAAFDSGYIAPCGPQVDEFERRLAALSDRKYAVALSSGTAAIDLILEELRVGPDWTVVAPTLSFIATVGPAWHRGADLAFVDCDATGNVDVALLDRALGELADGRRKLLVVGVDLYGRCCDYDGIARVARRHGAKFVVDAAESVGSVYKGRGSGSGGLAAVYSFNGNKTVTTSGGGALLTDSKGFAERAKKSSQQSRERKLYYEHKAVGHNYRMSNLLAAVGLAQLDRLPEILEKKRAVAEFYAGRFADRLADPAYETASNNWLNVVLLGSERARDAAIRRLAAIGIESRPVWKPLHLQPVFAGVRSFGGGVAEDLFRRGICLPSGAGLTHGDLERIAGGVEKA